jgi:hypothetical protein
VDLAPGKARTAALFRKPSQALEDAINHGRVAAVRARLCKASLCRRPGRAAASRPARFYIGEVDERQCSSPICEKPSRFRSYHSKPLALFLR